jgi:hypothetical protein
MVLSLSKSLKQGMSPDHEVSRLRTELFCFAAPTLNDLAEDTGRHFAGHVTENEEVADYWEKSTL